MAARMPVITQGTYGDSNRSRPPPANQAEITEQFAQKWLRKKRPREIGTGRALLEVTEGPPRGQDTDVGGQQDSAGAGFVPPRRDRDRARDRYSHEQSVRASAKLGQQLLLAQASAASGTSSSCKTSGSSSYQLLQNSTPSGHYTCAAWMVAS